MAGDSGCGGHFGADQMGATPFALPSLEVSVGCRGTPFPRLEDIRVHAEAHRAPGLPPLETGLRKDAIQPFFLRLHLHQSGTGYDDRVDTFGDLVSLSKACSSAQILDTTVRAGTDEDTVD